jgi:Type IV minor pilin ComP, DNA uptake sequence receptor
MRIFGLVSVILVLCVGFFIYQRSAASLPAGESATARIDTTAIRQRLLTIGQTERQYQASHGKYATLEELSQDNLLPGGTEQRGYTFTAEVNGSTGFTITATPTDRDKTDWPTLEITENMTVTQR